MDRLQHELQNEFQLGRLMLFTDAVFAIAITLLALEMRPPAVETGATDALIAEGLLALLPKLMGFFISFFLIGFYWTVHHRLCGQLGDYDQKLLWLNLLFLLTIVLMPFSTALTVRPTSPTWSCRWPCTRPTSGSRPERVGCWLATWVTPLPG